MTDPTTPSEKPASKGRILIVEEDILLREMLAGLFRAAEYDVTALADAQDAIDQVSTVRPGLIFINANPARVDGMMAAKVMRTILDDATLQIVFLVRPSDLLDVKDMFDGDGDDFITLPFKHEELVGKVRRKFALRNAHAKETDQVRVDTMSQLMVTVAHHINNALASIIARAHITPTDNPEDVELLLELIQKQSRRIQHVVESLIEMARSEELITTDYTRTGGQQMFDIAKRLQDKMQ